MAVMTVLKIGPRCSSRSLRWLPVVLLSLSLSSAAGACRRTPPPSPPPAKAIAPPAPITVVDAAPLTVAASAPSIVAPGVATVPAPSVGDETLVAEERDPDPRSATVTIKVIVDRRRKAHVFWGRKDLGEAPLDLQRPRDSGPVDLVVTAPGYLPLHTRAFTDRDDKLFLRLFPAQEAPQMLGYTPTDSERSARRPP
ncbi:MAG: hypothetical protein QOI66_3626 [Myxococcales bacterium]|nr:hypothetical protein [Myxococcales bacterium]